MKVYKHAQQKAYCVMNDARLAEFGLDVRRPKQTICGG
jgi:hypothetical protein